MTVKLTPQQAREQAAEATGFLAGITITINGEDFEIPQRGLLDDDQRDRLNELEMETESWDREDDLVLSDGDKRPGPLKVPYRKGGKLIKPGYPVRVAIALWGEEKYKRFKDGGGRASDVTATLARLDRKLVEREQIDSKSVAGGGDVGAGTE